MSPKIFSLSLKPPEAALGKTPSALLALGWVSPMELCCSTSQRGARLVALQRDTPVSPRVPGTGDVVSATAEGQALRFAQEHQAIGIAGAISAGQEQVCLLSLKPGIRGAQFPLLAKPRAVFCAKMRRDVQNTFIAHCFPSWALICDFSKGGGSAGFSISRCCSPNSE